MKKSSSLKRVVRSVMNPLKTARALRHRIRKQGTSRRIMKGSNEQAAKAVAKELYQLNGGGPLEIEINPKRETASVSQPFRSQNFPSRIEDPKLRYANLHAKRSFRAKSEWQNLRQNQQSKSEPAFYTGPQAASLLSRFMARKHPLSTQENRFLLEVLGVSPNARVKALGVSREPLTENELIEMEQYRRRLRLMIQKELFEEIDEIPEKLKEKLRTINRDFHKASAHLGKKVEKRKS